MNAANRRYLIELFSTIGIYLVLLFLSIALLQRFPQTSWRVALALLPMLPACFIPFVVVRALRRMDELQRQIQLEALGFAFGGTAVLTFAYGFLENGAGFPALSWFWVWPVMAILWLVGNAWASWRYR